MKSGYSTFAPPASKIAKYLECSIEELCSEDMTARYKSRFGKTVMIDFDALSPEEWDISQHAFAVDYLVTIGRGMHFFMGDKAFCDWLVSCVRGLDPDHVEFFWKELIPKNTAAVFHFPNESKLPSFASHLYPRGSFTRSGAPIKSATAIFSFSRATNHHFAAHANCSVFLNGPALFKDGFDYFPKLLVGLGMYASCFPEMIKEGPPTDLKHPSIHCCDNLRSRTVGVSPKIHHQNGSPTPHFRRGHFRVLNSEKFTHKRFQTVFVSESFVNASKSKTVLSP